MHDLDLTFDDVALVPQYNNIESRTEPDLSAWLTKKTKIGMPILAANMDTVISPELADILLSFGGIPIFHRFYKTDKELTSLLSSYGTSSFFSVGVTDRNYIDKVCLGGARGVVLDIAHGHSLKTIKTIEWMKHRWQGIEIIAGNVCTPEGYVDLVNAGADAVKVGIGPGAACTTRVVTGFGVPQFSAILKIGAIAKKYQVPFIADGGIKTSGDVVKALAAGASTVMVGKILALTDESAAPKNLTGAVYRGQASREFQNDYYGGMKSGTTAEGVEMFCNGVRPAKEVLDELLGGVRSGFTYGGARTIGELQKKFEYVRVTPSYQTESSVRR
jgi:IMP dehydrogenase